MQMQPSSNCRSELSSDIINNKTSNIYKLNLFDSSDSVHLAALRPSDKDFIKPSGSFQMALPKSSSGSSSKNLILFYWNGGGCMSSRLSVSPKLKSLLSSTKPDIFSNAETMVYSKSQRSLQNVLPGYDCFHHTAVKESRRMGISVFFIKQYCLVTTKTHVSKKYDII